jgi:hypothetical protein
MEKIANFQSKNAKHNVYLTKAQQLRNEVTRQQLEQHKFSEIEDKYLSESHMPKRMPLNALLKTLGVQRSQADS